MSDLKIPLFAELTNLISVAHPDKHAHFLKPVANHEKVIGTVPYEARKCFAAIMDQEEAYQLYKHTRDFGGTIEIRKHAEKKMIRSGVLAKALESLLWIMMHDQFPESYGCSHTHLRSGWLLIACDLDPSL